MALNIPNSIDTGTSITAIEHQQNYDTIKSHVNTEVIHRDGSVAFTQPQQGVTPVADSDLATKAYVDTEWIAFTPTWTNLTIGNATVDAKYAQIGKVVHVRGHMTWGTTTAGGDKGVQVSHPVASSGSDSVGSALLIDTGSGWHPMAVYVVNTTAVFIHSGAGVTATSPATWVAGDEWLWSYTYEAA